MIFSKQKLSYKLGMIMTFVLISIIGYRLGLFEIFGRSVERLRYAGLEDVRLILWREYTRILTLDFKNFFFGIGKVYDLNVFS